MRVSFQLEKILDRLRDKQHGRIQRICAYTHLERHQVAALLKNNIRYLSLDTLSRICDYLIDRYQVDPRELPGILFGLEAGEFWSMIGKHPYIEICQGMRSEGEESDHRWVMASDSSLLGVLLHQLFGLGHTPIQERPRLLEQRLVSAYNKRFDAQHALKEAETLYNRFNTVGWDRALVCLGSIKSNVLVELVIARAFHCEPFARQDNLDKPQDRSCPVYFRYREDDVKPPSCYAGMQLARSYKTDQPGIYFETKSGDWEVCPVTETQDAALVMYVWSPTKGKLEMVMGGFSGSATRGLAANLRMIPEQLWPPQLEQSDLKVGVFIVQFENRQRAGGSRDDEFADPLTLKKVIPLDQEVLSKRLDRRR